MMDQTHDSNRRPIRKRAFFLAAGAVSILGLIAFSIFRSEGSLTERAILVLGCFERGDAGCLRRYALQEEQDQLGLQAAHFDVLAEHARGSFASWTRVGEPRIFDLPENGVVQVTHTYRNQTGLTREFSLSFVKTPDGPKLSSVTGTVFATAILRYPSTESQLPNNVRNNLSFYQFLLQDAERMRQLGWVGLYRRTEAGVFLWEDYAERTRRVLELLGAEVDEQGQLVKFEPPPMAKERSFG
jgi:hypothetical protein